MDVRVLGRILASAACAVSCAGNPVEAITVGSSVGSADTSGADDSATSGDGPTTVADGSGDTTGPSGGDAICGDGIKEGNEECDFGDANGSSQCRDDCIVNQCGDGYLGPGESCDDGNNVGGDGCGVACGPDTCGNGDVDPGEACDDGNDEPNDGCTNACLEPLCGDGVVALGEQCDGVVDMACATMVGVYDSGSLGCTKACVFDTSGCGLCGDAQVSGTELCDPAVPAPSCAELGHDSGIATCSAACTIDESGCGDCGDGVRNGNEVCDGVDLGDVACVAGGTPACTVDCMPDLSDCDVCGDDVIGDAEECDGAAPIVATCVDFGYDDGTLACGASCELVADACCNDDLGDPCDDDANCCAMTMRCDDGECCRRGGASCQAPSECCSNVCVKGMCMGNGNGNGN